MKQKYRGFGAEQYNVYLRFTAFIFFCLLIFHDVQAGDKNRIKLDITTHLGGINTFQNGDNISFLISLDRDAYIIVIYENAKGELTQLVPNRNYRDSFIKAGLFTSLPPASAPFVFQVQPPFGREVLWGFASDSPLPELQGRDLKNGLKSLSGKITAIRNQIMSHTHAAFGESKLVINTRAAK